MLTIAVTVWVVGMLLAFLVLRSAHGHWPALAVAVATWPAFFVVALATGALGLFDDKPDEEGE